MIIEMIMMFSNAVYYDDKMPYIIIIMMKWCYKW